MIRVNRRTNVETEGLSSERLLRDLRALVHDSEDLLQATAGELSEKAEEARRRVTEALQQARQTCHDYEDRAWTQIKERGREVDEYVHEHPYRTIGMTLGVGVLVGLLMKRK